MTMSAQTFTVTPPKERDKNVIKRQHKFPKSVKCWLCRTKFFSLGRYMDHIERHRAEGWRPRDRWKGAKQAEVFAEWQQEEVSDASTD